MAGLEFVSILPLLLAYRGDRSYRGDSGYRIVLGALDLALFWGTLKTLI